MASRCGALLVLLALVHLFGVSSSTVMTKYGQVRGITTTPGTDLNPVVQYLGIPYALPPKGSRRFRPPQPPKPWPDVRNCTAFGPVCPQMINDTENWLKQGASVQRMRLAMLPFLKQMDEDCLYLNVYKRADLVGAKPKAAVMVFIHPGYFEEGAGSMYDGSAIASWGQVIVVTFNYRLGLLGFLSTGEDNAPGNYGLLDQIAALKWVQQNIVNFGGDPNNITVFGAEAGGASINLLALSPKAKGLFRRVIIQSGSALTTWALTSEPWRSAITVAHKMGCCLSNLTEMMDCLRRIDVDILTGSVVRRPPYFSMFGPRYFSLFGPVVDGIVVTDNPKMLMTYNGKDKDKYNLFKSYDHLIGVNEDEGFGYIETFPGVDYYGIGREGFTFIINDFVNKVYPDRENEIEDAIQFIYTNWGQSESNETRRTGMVRMFTEQQVGMPVVSVANLHSSGKTTSGTYFYTFNHRLTYGRNPPWVGAVQQEELPFVFGAPNIGGGVYSNMNYSRAESMLSLAIITYWSNFAKSGDPNAPIPQKTRFAHERPNRFENIKWPPYDADKQGFIYLGMKPRVKQGYRSQRVAFWAELIPKLVKHQQVIRTLDSPADVIEICMNLRSGNGPTDTAITRTPWNWGRYPEGGPRSTCPPQQPEKDKKPTTRPSFNWVDFNSYNEVTSDYHASGKRTYSSELSIVISVGVTLLALNLVVFAVCYKKRGKRRARHQGSVTTCAFTDSKISLKVIETQEMAMSHLKDCGDTLEKEHPFTSIEGPDGTDIEEYKEPLPVGDRHPSVFQESGLIEMGPVKDFSVLEEICPQSLQAQECRIVKLHEVPRKKNGCQQIV
ncbi:NLGN4X [Branchiostoma lanceolatum]|uniref:NLGN4X protein n=1 Tax=Branchiostoma lanceolatum TaxID=7740 RepID=A0A8K0F3I1_BRALA|nr:NLGN4X [Branchiostoma lanceolatum]